jgi:probable F420-dependent oxidoreductase
VKIRIGYGLGTSGLATRPGKDASATYFGLVDALEKHGFDSLWLSERVTAGTFDPIVGLSVAAGRTSRLKFGMSVMVLPGRNPVLLAKELATLDVLSGGRLLPAFGLGVVNAAEQQAFGVRREERASLFDETLPLLRRLWSEDAVDHHGPHFHYDDMRVLPKPVQKPLDVWLGGVAPRELRRVGQLADGWLPSFLTPEEAASRRLAVEEEASRAGRHIDPEHFGALVFYARRAIPDRLLQMVANRRPEVDPTDLIPQGWAATRATLERFIAGGFSKFVLVAVDEPASWADELGEAAAEVLPLQRTV